MRPGGSVRVCACLCAVQRVASWGGEGGTWRDVDRRLPAGWPHRGHDPGV
jgi:hypothetical protein